MNQRRESALGAIYSEGRCRFRVWGPRPGKIEVRVVTPRERLVTLGKDDQGYHHATVEGVEVGSLY